MSCLIDVEGCFLFCFCYWDTKYLSFLGPSQYSSYTFSSLIIHLCNLYHYSKNLGAHCEITELISWNCFVYKAVYVSVAHRAASTECWNCCIQLHASCEFKSGSQLWVSILVYGRSRCLESVIVCHKTFAHLGKSKVQACKWHKWQKIL